MFNSRKTGSKWWRACHVYTARKWFTSPGQKPRVNPGEICWCICPAFAACREGSARYRALSMNLAPSRNPSCAFSLVELLVLIAILLALFVVLVRPVNPGRLKNTDLLVCMSNLRQTVIGFVMWSDDHGGSWPWQVSTNKGGTMELIPNGRAADHFLTLSNYLKDPRVLACPTDRARYATNNFSGFDNQNLSYFAGLDAITNSSLSVLGGDRHLQIGELSVKPGLLVVSNGTPLGWTKALHAQSSQSPVGNLSFADGHVERVRAISLSRTFQRQALVTNQLVIP